MAFHSPLFLLLLVTSVPAYWAARRRRLYVLAVADALFYAAAGWPYLLLFAAMAGITYLCALRRGRLYLWSGIALNLANLGFFKYTHFLASNLQTILGTPVRVAGVDVAALRIVLPVGISFYTFQLISYLVDVHRDTVPPCRSFLRFWVYISFFAQLVAGPIMRAADLIPQLEKVASFRPSGKRLATGLQLVLLGLTKKLVFADTLAPFVDRLFALGTSMSSADAWAAAYLFGFQIYLDFSAYSEIALGIGHLFGMQLSRNFDSPYVSANPREFWRRWHITLSTWIRDYLYIPLGGSRHGFLRGCFALAVAMVLSGLWHGAAWTFAAWGAYHALLSIAHRLWLRFLDRAPQAARREHWQGGPPQGQPAQPRGASFPRAVARVASVLLTFHLVTIGWVFFRCPDIHLALVTVAKMVTWSAPGGTPHLAHYLALAAALALLHLAEYWARSHHRVITDLWYGALPAPMRGVVYAAVVLVLLVFTRPRPNAFIYFQF